MPYDYDSFPKKYEFFENPLKQPQACKKYTIGHITDFAIDSSNTAELSREHYTAVEWKRSSQDAFS